MADARVTGGSSVTFSAGSQTLGIAPAKITSATLRQNKGVVKFVLGLPADPNFATYAIYAQDNVVSTDPGFPGGSPISRGVSTKPEDDTAIVGVRRHYWIVTEDRYGAPQTRTAANAYYAGNIITNASSTLLSGTT